MPPASKKYGIFDNVTTEYSGSRIYGDVVFAIKDVNGQKILFPIPITDNGMKVDVGDSINVSVGSVTIEGNHTAISHGDDANEAAVINKSLQTKETLGSEMYTSGGFQTLGTGSTDNYSYGFTARDTFVQVTDSATVTVQPYNKVVDLDSLNQKLILENVAVSSVSIENTSGSPNDVQVLAVG